MADYKSAYSATSKNYIEKVIPTNPLDQSRYDRSKAREAEHDQDWLKQKVNINDVVNKFIPKVNGAVVQRSQGGVKYNFEGNGYIIKCDKAAGYLRIYNKQAKSYCTLDGTPSRDPLDTHFKIKRREEM